MSKFQQRHYEAIAEVIQDAYLSSNHCTPDDATNGVAQVLRSLADMFASDNNLFDRGRFERACIPGANVKARS